MSIASAKLGDLVSITSGFAFESSKFNGSGEGLPLVRIRDVTRGYSDTFYLGDFRKDFAVENGDALIGMDGEFNLAKWSGGSALLNQRVCKVATIDKRLDHEYLIRFLPSALKKIEDATPFVTVKHLSVKTLRDIEVPLPPLPEQRRIAAILNKADALRAKRRLAIAKLDQLLQSVFLEMFGDPVTNPKGWALRTLANLGVQFRYGTSNKSGESGYVALRIPNIVGTSINASDIKTVEVTDIEFKRLKLLDGDLLFVRTNGNPDFVGRCSVFDQSELNRQGIDGSKCIYASYLIRARIPTERIKSIFIREFLRSAEGRRLLRAQSRTSAGQYNINTEGLGAIVCPIPPLSLQVEFERIVEQVKKVASVLEEAFKSSNMLAKSIQRSAFDETT